MMTKERRKKQHSIIRATRPKPKKRVRLPDQHDWDGDIQWPGIDTMLSAMQSNKRSVARPKDWLYNGEPALCRKCACVWGTTTKCNRDHGHVCELESVTSAEDRRLSEVHRRLKAAFGEQPSYSTMREHYDHWLSLVGLDRN